MQIKYHEGFKKEKSIYAKLILPQAAEPNKNYTV